VPSLPAGFSATKGTQIMALKALKDLWYGGQTIPEGEEFEAFSPLHERTLIAIKRAELVEEGGNGKPKSRKAKVETDEVPTAKAVEAKSTAKDTVGKDNKYQTRKLTAEDD
jgi:hypothetical protein